LTTTVKAAGRPLSAGESRGGAARPQNSWPGRGGIAPGFRNRRRHGFGNRWYRTDRRFFDRAQRRHRWAVERIEALIYPGEL